VRVEGRVSLRLRSFQSRTVKRRPLPRVGFRAVVLPHARMIFRGTPSPWLHVCVVAEDLLDQLVA